MLLLLKPWINLRVEIVFSEFFGSGMAPLQGWHAVWAALFEYTTIGVTVGWRVAEA